jgi:hypothetical protein
MPVSEDGPLDMSTFFERQRRVIFSATLALAVMGGLATYLDRNNFQGWKPNDWVGAELLGLLLAIVRCWLVGQSRAGCNGSGLAACSFRTFRFLFSTRSVPNRVP